VSRTVVFPFGVLERRRDDELRHRVELVGELALSVRPRAREALVGPAADQQCVGLARLLQLELVAVVPAVELEAPAGILEVRLASGRLHHAVERYELRHNDSCGHGGLPPVALSHGPGSLPNRAVYCFSLNETRVDSRIHRQSRSE
jgi:hypothetical protein